MKEQLILLGASGSIGQQVLELLQTDCKDHIELVALSVGVQTNKLKEIIERFPTLKDIWVLDDNQLEILSKQFNDVHFYSNETGFDHILDKYPRASVINAIRGFEGLYPTLSSLKTPNRKLLLANKESLVLAGDLIKELVINNNATLYPLDSEHCAIFECVQNKDPNEIKTIYLTASGGMFKDYSSEQLQSIDDSLAFKHPNWTMGTYITIDSSTMMNKALEVIEAYHLFNNSNIEVLIHPQSIIHSAVEFNDYSILAQLSKPDMKYVINYFLNNTKHSGSSLLTRLDFSKGLNLSLQNADLQRWKALKLAYKCLDFPSSLSVVMNAANEAVRDQFINRRIRFYQIVDYVEYFMSLHDPFKIQNYTQIRKLNDNIKKEIINYFTKDRTGDLT